MQFLLRDFTARSLTLWLVSVGRVGKAPTVVEQLRERPDEGDAWDEDREEEDRFTSSDEHGSTIGRR